MTKSSVTVRLWTSRPAPWRAAGSARGRVESTGVLEEALEGGRARVERARGRSSPSTTPPTELELRNVTRLHPDRLFASGTGGAHRASVLLGILPACHAQGAPARVYLTWPFERLGPHPGVFAFLLEAMTPSWPSRTPA